MAAHIEQDDELTMSTHEFMQAELELYHHCVAFVKSIALKTATDLRIPDAIHRRGGAATMSELAEETGIHPTKVPEPASAVSLFEQANGRAFFDTTVNDGGLFSGFMAADSRVNMQVLLKEYPRVFRQVRSSLVDVGGSHGATAAAVAKAFPHIKCTVLDLPDVVAGAPVHDSLTFIAGDMFQYIPPADAVLLKWILHDWKHEECVKIMRRCKEAIPPRDAGGKVIIIDMVIGYPLTLQNDAKEAQALMDVCMMYIDGIEREEHEWSKIFFEAGFSDYKITPTNGVRSIIEVYP